MALRSMPQLGMDEQTINDPTIAAALEARQDKKDELAALRREYEEVNEKAIAEVAKLELPDGAAVRVGRFRIERKFVPGRTVESFETKAKSRVAISLFDAE